MNYGEQVTAQMSIQIAIYRLKCTIMHEYQIFNGNINGCHGPGGTPCDSQEGPRDPLEFLPGLLFKRNQMRNLALDYTVTHDAEYIYCMSKKSCSFSKWGSLLGKLCTSQNNYEVQF